MTSKLIPFRKDNESIVWLTYEQMIDGMDACGYITLDDGEVARRARDLEPSAKRLKKSVVACQSKIVSDSLGFTSAALEEQKALLNSSDCVGIEFKEDPSVPNFYQVHCSDEKAKREYMKLRGYTDNNSRNGSGSLGEVDLRNAQELVQRQFASQPQASQ